MSRKWYSLLAMTQAERIRQFALDHYVAIARAEGRTEIIIRAGDVHQAMGLVNAMPAVCSAIGSNKFNELASVTPGARTGPANGANVYFQFSLVARP
jgi:5-methylcytosine-specific restriction protein B